MNDKFGPWVSSFSHSQQCFDVDTQKAYLDRSRRCILEKIPFDWAVIGIFENHKEASEFCHYVREKAGIKNIIERFMEEHPSEVL